MSNSTDFSAYKSKRTHRTLSAHEKDLADLEAFLYSQIEEGERIDLFNKPEAWSHITADNVVQFVRHLYVNGKPLFSIGRALSTIRVYAKIAKQFGFVSTIEFSKIKNVAVTQRSILPKSQKHILVPYGSNAITD